MILILFKICFSIYVLIGIIIIAAMMNSEDDS